MTFEIENGLMVEIDENNKTASIIKSPNARGNINIGKYYQKDNSSEPSEQYKIISIKDYAFEKCSIDSLTFSDDSEVESFGSRCFRYAKIKKLQIPPKVKKIDNCFIHIDSLNEIEVSPNNQYFILHNNQILLGKSKEDTDKYDILHFAMFDAKEVVIPSQISVISQYSFYSHKNLTTVTFESNSALKIIGEHSFSHTKITDLIFPASVEEIEDNSFLCTSQLKTVKFPTDSKLRKIGKSFNESGIESIFVPASVEFIDEDCFINTPKLNEIKIAPENKFYKSINDNFIVKENEKGSGNFDTIFIARRNLDGVTIPANIKVIGSYSFHKCKELKNLKFEDNSSLETIKNNAFGFITPEKIVFPPSLKEVGRFSLSGNNSIKCIDFLSKSIKIRTSCFNSCGKLSTITFKKADQIVFESKEMDKVPNSMKILVNKDAQLSGDGLDQCRSRIFFFEDIEAMEEAERKKKEEEEERKRIEEEEEKKKRIEIEREKRKRKKVEKKPDCIISKEEAKENFIEEVFNQPTFNDEEIENVPKKEVFLEDEVLDESIQNKPYDAFLPTLSLYFQNPNINYQELTDLLGDDAVILNVKFTTENEKEEFKQMQEKKKKKEEEERKKKGEEKNETKEEKNETKEEKNETKEAPSLASTFVQIALLSTLQQDADTLQQQLDQYIKGLKEKISLQKDQYPSIIGNFDSETVDSIFETIVNIPSNEEIQKACCRPSYGFIQNAQNLNTNDLKEIKEKVIQNLVYDKIMYKYNQFLFEYEEIFKQMEQKIQEDLTINQYEMVIVNRTQFANKFIANFEEIKKAIGKNKFIEFFCYHGSRLSNHQRILEEHFKLQNEAGSKKTDDGWYGVGIYSTDNQFYAAYYANRVDVNRCEVLNYDQTAHILVCLAIYNKSLAVEVKDLSFRGKDLEDDVIKGYGIHQVLVGDSYGFQPIKPSDKKGNKITAYEFVFPQKYQIIPLCSIGLMRKKYYILWKDDNIGSDENMRYQKELSKNKEIRVYRKDDIDDALKVIKNKKYACCKLITNGGKLTEEKKLFGTSYKCPGKTLIEEARKIIGKKFVCLVFAANLDHLKWISKMENVLFAVVEKDFKQFAELEMTLDNVLAFKDQLEEKYKGLFPGFKIKEDELLYTPPD